jgi:hypothetical protein
VSESQITLIEGLRGSASSINNTNEYFSAFAPLRLCGKLRRQL